MRGGAHVTKIIVAYYSKTGNTEKIACLIVEGIKKVPGVTAELKHVESIEPREAAEADGFVFGSPAYFSMMAGPMLTLLTELYFARDKLSGKTMAAFSTGGGSQTKTIANIESVLKAFNPKLIQPGLAVGPAISETDEEHARKFGVTIAKAVKESQKSEPKEK